MDKYEKLDLFRTDKTKGNLFEIVEVNVFKLHVRLKFAFHLK